MFFEVIRKYLINNTISLQLWTIQFLTLSQRCLIIRSSSCEMYRLQIVHFGKLSVFFSFGKFSAPLLFCICYLLCRLTYLRCIVWRNKRVPTKATATLLSAYNGVAYFVQARCSPFSLDSFGTMCFYLDTRLSGALTRWKDFFPRTLSNTSKTQILVVSTMCEKEKTALRMSCFIQKHQKNNSKILNKRDLVNCSLTFFINGNSTEALC